MRAGLRNIVKTAQAPEIASHHEERVRTVWGAVIVAFAAALPFALTLRYNFVFDDDTQVLANPAITAWRFVPAYFAKPIAGFFSGMVSAHYYRPLFFLWFRLNYFLWGTHFAWGWHLMNIALHVAASLLVLAVFRRYFTDQRWAVAGALIFAVHPAHLETVAWISGCTDSLMAISFLGCLYLWMRNREAPSLTRRAGSMVCCASALFSKETAVILPVIIFFHALTRIAEPEAPKAADSKSRVLAALRNASPYALVTIVCLLVRARVLSELPGSAPWISKLQALLTAPSLLWFYARHLVWPAGLSINYDLPVVQRLGSVRFWFLFLLFSGLSIGAWRCLGKVATRVYALAALWFFLPLAPVLYIRHFQRDDFVHDRYLYLPVLSVAILTAALGQYLDSRNIFGNVRSGALMVVGAVILCLALGTVVQARPWENNLTLYSNAVRRAPKSALARNNLASEYAARRRYQEASELLKALLADRPDLWLANYNYGFVNYYLGNLPLAEAYLNRAIRIDPADPDEHVYLGTTYMRQGRLQEAAEQLRTAIARKPNGNGYHLTLGVIYLQEGNLAAAREEIAKELTYHPENAAVRAQLQAIDKQLANPSIWSPTANHY
jgi:tetratricopeptide (TPR) repeat protein